MKEVSFEGGRDQVFPNKIHRTVIDLPLERLGRYAGLDLLEILQSRFEYPAILGEAHRGKLSVHACSLSELSDKGVLRGIGSGCSTCRW